jgi:hypothetical protein
MAWSKDRRYFAAALTLFLVWVAVLTFLSIVSANRPVVRTSQPPEPSPGVSQALGAP